MGRIQHLDGLRGVAILLVLFYHAFVRWANILPYGDNYSNIIFEQGFLGVQLFFLISGFVILMTLDKTVSFTNFIYRRWLRLFPAMLICSFIIYFSANFFNARPSGEVHALNLIPGLLFIEPYWLEKIIGLPFESVENAFWSLYVEFKFYILSAFLYFFVKDKKLAFTLFGFFMLWVLASAFNENFDNRFIYMIYALTTHLSFEYFGWFASGSCFYLFHKYEQRSWFFYGVIMAVISSVTLYIENYNTMISALLISLFFACSFVFPFIQKILSFRLLIFIGFISYPFYLLHENMIISLSIELPETFVSMPLIIAPMIAIVFIIFLSYIISKYMEVPVKNVIRLICDKFASKLNPQN